MDHLDRFAKAAWERVKRGYYRLRDGRRREPLSLARAIAEAQGKAIIAEVKPASPTAGDLLRGRGVAEVASAYAAAGAVGISVLVDPDHFSGALEHLRLLGGLGVPLLAKDFVVDPVQLAAFHRAGADCALLIVALFERGYPSLELDRMIAHAHGLGLEVLLEASSREELECALATQADLIGVNSRDPTTLEVSLDRAMRALDAARPDPSRPILALSGISSGEGDLGPQAGGLFRVPGGDGPPCGRGPRGEAQGTPFGMRIKVKICGLRSVADVLSARGADALGVIVATPASPRNLDLDTAREVLSAAPPGLLKVAVTTAVAEGILREIASALRPDV
ncbi:hypothetical protein LR090_03800, partial [Candidatus Bipolaricaulota bacterium]|nr:hypothetical protein [Candidatus Bipolaricaulota bacterium]